MSKVIQFLYLSRDFDTQHFCLQMPNGFMFILDPDTELLALAEIAKQVTITDKAFERFIAESEEYTGIKLTQTSFVSDSELLVKKEAAANIVPSKWINLNTKEEPCWIKKEHIEYVRYSGSGIYKALVYVSAIKDYIHTVLSVEEVMEQLNES